MKRVRTICAVLIGIAWLLLPLDKPTVPEVPTVEAAAVYDCDTAREVCYAIYTSTSDLCLTMGGDPIKCSQDWLNNVARCVSGATDGQCNIDASKDKVGTKSP